jgi:hypothetical protein
MLLEEVYKKKNMATIILIISGILFISTFVIHLTIMNGNEIDKPLYTRDPLMSSIPWIAGFIMPVFSWSNISDFNWLGLFFINFAVAFIFGPWFTKGFLVRFASGRGPGEDMVTAFVAGIISLIIGLFLK